MFLNSIFHSIDSWKILNSLSYFFHYPTLELKTHFCCCLAEYLYKAQVLNISMLVKQNRHIPDTINFQKHVWKVKVMIINPLKIYALHCNYLYSHLLWSTRMTAT